VPQNGSPEDKRQAARAIQQAWEELTAKVVEEFRINGFEAKDVMLRPGFRMQYMGQLNDLEIVSPIHSAASEGDWDAMIDAFENTYARVYASAARSPELGFSVTGVIMRGTVATQKPVLPEDPDGGLTPPAEARLGTRKLYRHKRWLDAVLWKMEALKPGNEIFGPAIIESDATTFVVPDGFATTLDKHRLFHLREIDKTSIH
jgi:acetone carboxylase beta subunit